MTPRPAPWREELRRAWPYGLALGLLLGGDLVVGAHLSHAFPSEARPFGWPGPANLENAVAMVRGDLVLAASLPGLLLGATAWRGPAGRRPEAGALLTVIGVDVVLLAAGTLLATLLGAWGAAQTAAPAYVAFWTAHVLLALAFYSLALLCAGLARRHAVPAALGVWLFYAGLFDSAIQAKVMREAGYHRLAAGDFPEWFYAAQAFSPLTAYRGTLILWRPGFRNALEKAALDGATLPAWMSPAVFGGILALLWVLVPLGVALLAWRWQGRRSRSALRRRAEPA